MSIQEHPAGRAATALAEPLGFASWMPYRLFEYERVLGARELTALGLRIDAEDDKGIAVTGDVERALARATYFDTVAGAEGAARRTDQGSVEIAHHLRRRKPSRRQATRYGLHGLHEYKGKFNPQVVRALCNVFAPEARTLIDPFCGSGTSLLEGLRLGMDVVGIDDSPMACFIARAKVGALAVADRPELASSLTVLGAELEAVVDRAQATAAPVDPHGAGWTPGTAAYLQRWFDPAAYSGVGAAAAHLRRARPTVQRDLASACFSSVLREVSLQRPEDLRVRRRAGEFVAPPISVLLAAAVEKARTGLLELAEGPAPTGCWSVRNGSCEEPASFLPAATGGGRFLITSPPYATALPYIDTDRLSVLALGLADADQLAAIERKLIGSREWTRRQSGEWELRLAADVDDLGADVIRLCAQIVEANGRTAVGFRRQAVPSLLYRYFARMGRAMACWTQALRAGETAVMIVGHNHTRTADGDRIEINTPALLGAVAERRGFELVERLQLAAWPRYGLHSANGVGGEDAVVLRRR